MTINYPKVLQVSNMEMNDGGPFYSSLSTHLGYFHLQSQSKYIMITNQKTAYLMKDLSLRNNYLPINVRKRSAKCFHLWNSLRMSAAIRHFDFIHIHGIFTNSHFLVIIFATLLNKKILWQPHGMLTDYDLQKHFYMKKIYLLFYVIVLNPRKNYIIFSSSQENLECSVRPFRNFKSRVIPYPPTVEELFLAKEEDLDIGIFQNRFNILFYGRVTPKKRLDLLISAVSQLNNLIPNIQLVVVGPTDRNGMNVIEKERKLFPKISYI